MAAFKHKKMLLDQENIETLANYICNMSWTFCYNVGERPYITSDNPVVIVDHEFNYGTEAIMSNEKKMIQYPLSPQVMLLIMNEGYTGAFDSEKMDVEINDEKYLELIDYPNFLQMDNACRYVFTKDYYDEKYFEDNKAGIAYQSTSPAQKEYEKAMEEFEEKIPRLHELLRKLDSPDCTDQKKKAIQQEVENIYSKVNKSRKKIGKPAFEIFK